MSRAFPCPKRVLLSRSGAPATRGQCRTRTLIAVASTPASGSEGIRTKPVKPCAAGVIGTRRSTPRPIGCIYERHREELASYFAQYRREHRDVRQAIHARRRARKLEAEGSYTTIEWVELLQRWNWTCAYCGEHGALEPEHRIPLARGGSNSIENILPACRRCNQRKALLTEEEFRARLATEGGGSEL